MDDRYHMYGATIGSLNIYFKPEDTASRLMFTKSGNQGNQWFHGIFELPKTNISFQVRIIDVFLIKKLTFNPNIFMYTVMLYLYIKIQEKRVKCKI